jgi:catechol 2,3-dioxygenase-like lactoylglutathione lyase family enzyme
MHKATNIGAVVFYVRDLRKTQQFYRDVLGIETRILPTHEGENEPAGEFMMGDVGTTSLVFFPKNEPIGRSPIVVFGLEGGIDDFFDQVVAYKADVVLPVSHAPGGWSCDFRDPDEHVLSFYQSADKPRRLKK